MKKVIVSAILSALLPVSSAFAAVSFNAETDFSKGTISVSGKADANKYITVQIFKDGKAPADFLGSESNAAEYSVFVGQKLTDENGAFAFDLKYSGSTEELDGYLKEEGSAAEHFKVDFINAEEYRSFIADLNDLAKADDKEEFINVCKNGIKNFSTDEAIYNSINKDKTAELFFYSVKSKALSADGEDANIRFTTCIAAQTLNENKLTSVSLILKSDLPADLLEEIKLFTSGAEAEKYYISLAQGKSITDVESYEKVCKEAMILTVAKYPQGFVNLQTICEKYASFIGITGSYSSAAYKEVAGNGASSLSDLLSKLSAAQKSGNGSGSTGGSSGGSGGSSGKKNNGSFVPIVSDGPSGSNAKTDEIKMPFEDMSAVSWAYTAVSSLADKGIIAGKSETQFYPNDYITREEFVKIIVCAANVEIDETVSYFEDVDADKWYAKYVNTAYKLGICKGISENEFGVGMNIKRQDAAVMVYNLLAGKNNFETEKTDFTDYEEVGAYAKEAVSKLAGAAIINGTDNAFRPEALLTRAEAAQIIYRSIDKF